MKNRKLFAILTLVAFMMTLLPVAAFAADVTADLSAAASFTTIDKTSVKADGTKKATITMVARKSTGAIIDGVTPDPDDTVTIYLKSSRDAETFTVKDATGPVVATAGTPTSTTGAQYDVVPNADGEIDIEVVSSVAGEVTISLYKEVVATKGAEDGLLIGKETVEFTSDNVDVDEVKVISIKDGSTVLADEDNVTVGNEVTVKVKVEDASNNGISDKEVTLQKRIDDGTWQTVASKKTDVLGYAEWDFSSNETGLYEFRAKVGSTVGTDHPGVTYVAGSAVEVKAKAATKVMDVDATSVLRWEIFDNAGNELTTDDLLEVKIQSVPEDSDIDEAVDGTYDWDSADDKAYEYTFDPDVVGTYVVRGYIAGTGLYDEVTVTVKEATEATQVTVDFEDDMGYSLTNNGDSMTLDVALKDADGVEISSTASDFVLASSNVELLTTAADSFVVTAVDDTDKSGVVTVTVTHIETGLAATIDIPVVGTPVAVDVEQNIDGKKAEVTMYLVDKNGNKTNTGAAVDYTVFKDEDVVVSGKKAFGAETGKAEFDVAANEYGKYSFNVVTENGIAKTFTVDFEMPEAEKPVYGAKNVTMFIGSTGFVLDGAAKTMDQAPFIQDGRTFVPVRMVGEALGAEVEYDAATQMITLTRDDMTVTMTVGSNILTKSAGEAVVSDVAPFIVVETGRTVIPFRAIAEAFGADVDAVFAADGTVTAVTFAQ